jgi:hypothetical protein
MALILFFIAVVAVCVLGAVFGSDSRYVDAGRQRPTWF